MDLSTTAYVTSVEPVTSRINANGSAVLNVGEVGATGLSIVVSALRLTPIEQVDFLRALAEEASELAARVAALHAEPVGVKG